MSRITILAPTIATAALALAACGSSKDPVTGTNASATTKGDPVAFSHCMRTNGVPNFPDPQNGGIRVQATATAGSGQSLTVNGVSVNAPAFRAAQAKCQKYMPFGGKPTAAQIAKLRAGALAMARCMRAHGVTHFPDPDVTTGPGGVGIRMRIGIGSTGIDANSPAFRAAMNKCQSLMGGIGPKSAGSGQAAAGG